MTFIVEMSYFTPLRPTEYAIKAGRLSIEAVRPSGLAVAWKKLAAVTPPPPNLDCTVISGLPFRFLDAYFIHVFNERMESAPR